METTSLELKTVKAKGRHNNSLPYYYYWPLNDLFYTYTVLVFDKDILSYVGYLSKCVRVLVNYIC